MDLEKLLWLGIYVKLRSVFKCIKLFEFGDPEEVLNELGFKREEVLDIAYEELEKADKKRVKILFFKEFRDFTLAFKYPPLFLYAVGNFKKAFEIPLIGVVGTRKPTNYGKEVTVDVTKQLVKSGLGVISGMARGIDTIAHKTTLKEKGYTVGILGSGIDVIYPPENKKLFKDVIESGGCVMSEFPFGTPPRKENFPIRNRIISGFSRAIIVVEAAKKSGTLITAKWALEQGKEVFAVPGSVFSPQSQGTHFLIKQGAHPLTSVKDLLDVLGFELTTEKSSNSSEEELTTEEKRVLSVVSDYPQHVDELISKLQISAFELLSLLTELELKGLIEMLPGKYVKLKPRH